MRILSVTQLKPFVHNHTTYPLDHRTKIKLDKKSPANKKEHCLLFQQGRNYGSVGDSCQYLNNDELIELEEKGFISIRKTK